MTITALPTPPSRTDPTNFSARSDAFLTALPTFVSEANALSAAVNVVAAAVDDIAANLATDLAAPAWVSGGSYVLGDVVYDASNGRTYRCIASTSSAVAPSALPTKWTAIALDNMPIGQTTPNKGRFTELDPRGLADISSNVCIGNDGVGVGTTGTDLVAVGYQALKANTGGYNNVAIGSEALKANTAGNGNTAVGKSALLANTTGGANVSSGYVSLSANTTGSYNAAFGASALGSNTTGANNVAVGNDALYGNVTGARNVALGASAMQVCGSQNNNTALGYSALASANGGGNTAVGAYAGQSVTTGAGNVILGGVNSSGNSAPAYDVTTENDRISIGSTATTNAYVQVAWTVLSDARDKTDIHPIPHGLDFCNALDPISYRFRVERASDATHGPTRYGFIAQDILAVEGDSPVVVDASQPEKLRMTSDALIPILVRAIQELTMRLEALERA